MRYSAEQLQLHAIMYAKSHYQSDPQFNGLKKIVSLCCGVDVEWVNEDYLLHFCLDLLETYGSKKLTKQYFILELFRELRWYKQKDDNVTKMDVVNHILSILRMTKAADLPPLPEPDPAIWGLKNKVSAAQLTKLAFPNCAHSCAAVESLGVSECDNVCPFKSKITKDEQSTTLSQEELDNLSDDVKQIPRVDKK